MSVSLGGWGAPRGCPRCSGDPYCERAPAAGGPTDASTQVCWPWPSVNTLREARQENTGQEQNRTAQKSKEKKRKDTACHGIVWHLVACMCMCEPWFAVQSCPACGCNYCQLQFGTCTHTSDEMCCMTYISRPTAHCIFSKSRSVKTGHLMAEECDVLPICVFPFAHAFDVVC